MSRYYGKVAYRVPVEQKDSQGRPNGVWVDEKVIREYKGDILKNYNRNSNGESINDNSLIQNNISIVADPFTLANFTSIIYLEYLGVKWKVSSVDASNPPRLILSLGGIYNEEA